MESVFDIIISFIIEYITTSILVFVIFINIVPCNSYITFLKINDSEYTYGHIITGIILITLLYVSNVIAVNTHISAGQMTPLLTISFMIISKVSYVKGIFLLIAQVFATFTACMMTLRLNN